MELDLRCFNCGRLGYFICYAGDHGVCGYLCELCIRLIEGFYKRDTYGKIKKDTPWD